MKHSAVPCGCGQSRDYHAPRRSDAVDRRMNERSASAHDPFPTLEGPPVSTLHVRGHGVLGGRPAWCSAGRAPVRSLCHAVAEGDRLGPRAARRAHRQWVISRTTPSELNAVRHGFMVRSREGVVREIRHLLYPHVRCSTRFIGVGVDAFSVGSPVGDHGGAASAGEFTRDGPGGRSDARRMGPPGGMLPGRATSRRAMGGADDPDLRRACHAPAKDVIGNLHWVSSPPQGPRMACRPTTVVLGPGLFAQRVLDIGC